MGAVDQEPRRGARHAAVPRRSDDRHPVVQGRSVAERRRDSDDCTLGGCRRPAGQPRRHAAAAHLRQDGRLADRRAGSRDQVPAIPGGGRRPRSVRRALRRHSDRRGPLHPGDPDAVRDPGVAQGRAPRPVVLGVQRPTTRSRPWTKASSSSSTRRARTPRSTRRARACCCRRASVRASATTCTPSARRRGPRSSSESSSIPKGYVPKHIRWSRQLAQPTTPLDIPAGTVARSDGYTILHKPARLIAFQPHMHNLGKRQCLEVIYPTSGTRTSTEMLNCADFNNNWHLTYNYAEDAQPLVPAGNDPAQHPVARQHARPTRARSIRRTGSATGSAPSTRWASSGLAGSS